MERRSWQQLPLRRSAVGICSDDRVGVSERSPWVGDILEGARALSAWVTATASLKVTVIVNLEVKTMVEAICFICLAAGTAFLGRSGDTFPKPGEIGVQNQGTRL